MALIRLSNGQFAIVDDCDADLGTVRWFPKRSARTTYAVRTQWSGGVQRNVRLHRLVAERAGIDLSREEVDHINGNGLDNRRSNLRGATRRQNCCNRGTQVNNTSGHKGVSWHKGKGKWQAYITVNRKRIYVGCFDSLNEAAAARAGAAQFLHGEFVRAA